MQLNNKMNQFLKMGKRLDTSPNRSMTTNKHKKRASGAGPVAQVVGAPGS